MLFKATVVIVVIWSVTPTFYFSHLFVCPLEKSLSFVFKEILITQT